VLRLPEIKGRVKNMKLLLNEDLIAEGLIKNIVPFGFKRLNQSGVTNVNSKASILNSPSQSSI
jgi:hypothetical protein